MSDTIIHMPQHVAIIMDGNGRWAKQQDKTRTFGHKAGAESVRRAITFARRNGIKVLTLFAFSSENWSRPAQEVNLLMELFMTVLKRETEQLAKHGVRLNVVGDISRFSKRLQNRIQEAEEKTAHNTALTLNIAANYGGRWDIVDAAKKLHDRISSGEVKRDEVTESLFAEGLSLAGQPEPDLLIRTGGDVRISNFLLWQLAYAELYFTETLWPDFDENCFAQAIDCFVRRERRFGLTSEQIQQLTDAGHE